MNGLDAMMARVRSAAKTLALLRTHIRNLHFQDYSILNIGWREQYRRWHPNHVTPPATTDVTQSPLPLPSCLTTTPTKLRHQHTVIYFWLATYTLKSTLFFIPTSCFHLIIFFNRTLLDIRGSIMYALNCHYQKFMSTTSDDANWTIGRNHVRSV